VATTASRRRLLPGTAAPAPPWAARRAGDGYGVSDRPDWREVDWSAHLHATEIDGARVTYVDVGAGDATPVVFVHGLSGQWQNWLENIPRVAQERRVVALDLPGFGTSEMPREQISIPGYGRCVDALRDHLGLDRVALVGNSLGGFIAAEVAIQFPARVERLALVSAAGITSSNLRRRPALTVGRIAVAITAVTAAQQRAMAARPRGRHLALALVARYPSRLRADIAWEGLMKGAGRPGFQPALRASLEYDFRDRLPEIDCPTLIVWGRNDAVIPAKDAQEFERLIEGSRSVMLDDTGHVPMLERPVAFNDLLLEFL
jgi:pimeloyl-ACP methyl ester carboxylesterase